MSKDEKPELLAEAISNFNLDCWERTGFKYESTSWTIISFLNSFGTFGENLTTLDKETFTSPAPS